MIVAGIQMDIAWENPAENFRRVEEMARRAMEGSSGPIPAGPEMANAESEGEGPMVGPRLLVLPEMFATGFSMNSAKVSAFAEETREFLAGLASRLSVFVLGGYAEPAQPLPANACSIFAPDGGELLHYRKLHPFSLAREGDHYIEGETLETVELEEVRVTPLICYDLRFPEPFRPAARTTDLYCVIANWPDKRREAWSTLLRARAIENQAFVLGVNRVGVGSGELHAGDSALVDPMGAVISALPAYEEGAVLGPVDAHEVKKVRRHLGFLKDRRPGLYRRLEDSLG
jgi:predicted amidohydrolase